LIVARTDGREQLFEYAYLRRLGKRVRLLRLTRELSQEQLADASAMSRNFVSSIERGAHGVDVVRLLRLAGALGVSIEQIVADPESNGSP
jgi:transcriptional regulator with XRE-family HTH domain